MNKDIEYAEYEISTFEFVICKYEYKVANILKFQNDRRALLSMVLIQG